MQLHITKWCYNNCDLEHKIQFGLLIIKKYDQNRFNKKNLYIYLCAYDLCV